VEEIGIGEFARRSRLSLKATESLAAQYPELSLRTESAHREAFVALPDEGDEAVHWHLAGESEKPYRDMALPFAVER
jgi:hypothetical protein